MKITITRNDWNSYTARIEWPDSHAAVPVNITCSTAYEAAKAAAREIQKIEEAGGINWN